MVSIGWPSILVVQVLKTPLSPRVPDPLYIGSCDYCSPPGSQTRLGCSHYRQKLVWVCHNILFQTDHPDRPGLRELLPEPEKPRWETGVRSCQRGRKVDPKPE